MKRRWIEKYDETQMLLRDKCGCNIKREMIGKKHKTVIESNSFIGSGTRLVAPIKIAKGSYIGAGSTLTKDTIGDGTLTIARARQVTIEKWKKRDKKGKK